MSLEIQWRCLKCLHVNNESPAPPGTGHWTCAKCREVEPAHPEALCDGKLARCPACGCPDIYRQRDFNRRLGIGIVLLGCALAPFTNYLSIIACVLVDVAIYYFVGEAVVCYHCHAVMRGYPGEGEVPLFDLNTSDKYIETERERGW